MPEEVDLLHLQRIGSIRLQSDAMAEEYGVDLRRKRFCQRVEVFLYAKVRIQLACNREIESAVPSVPAADGLHVRSQLVQQPRRGKPHTGVGAGDDNRFSFITKELFQIHRIVLFCCKKLLSFPQADTGRSRAGTP